MKVTPVIQNPSTPQVIQRQNDGGDAKQRAIKAFMEAGKAPQQPGQNHSGVSQQASAPQPVVEEVQEEVTQVEGEVEQPSLEAVSETPAEPQAPKSEESLSPQHLALIRREKALRAQAQKQEQALKQREAELAAREAALTKPSQSQDLSKFISKDDFKLNPLKALADAGVSYEELTERILSQGTVDPRIDAQLRAAEEKIARLEQMYEDSKKSQAEQETAQYQAALKQIESDAKRLVYAGDEFEMIKVTNSTKDVVDLIEKTFKETGEVMSVEEAAQQVEDYLIEEAERLANTNKLKKRLNLGASKQEQPTQVQKPSAQQTQQPQMKTLTNSNSTPRQLTAKERAILAFRGELK